MFWRLPSRLSVRLQAAMAVTAAASIAELKTKPMVLTCLGRCGNCTGGESCGTKFGRIINEAKTKGDCGKAENAASGHQN